MYVGTIVKNIENLERKTKRLDTISYLFVGREGNYVGDSEGISCIEGEPNVT